MSFFVQTSSVSLTTLRPVAQQPSANVAGINSVIQLATPLLASSVSPQDSNPINSSRNVAVISIPSSDSTLTITPPPNPLPPVSVIVAAPNNSEAAQKAAQADNEPKEPGAEFYCPFTALCVNTAGIVSGLVVAGKVGTGNDYNDSLYIVYDMLGLTAACVISSVAIAAFRRNLRAECRSGGMVRNTVKAATGYLTLQALYRIPQCLRGKGCEPYCDYPPKGL